jgi:hypothetical protein
VAREDTDGLNHLHPDALPDSKQVATILSPGQHNHTVRSQPIHNRHHSSDAKLQGSDEGSAGCLLAHVP